MNVDLLQDFFANIDESVRRLCFHNKNVTWSRFVDGIANHDTGAALLHQNNLVIFVEMQRCTPSWLRFYIEMFTSS